MTATVRELAGEPALIVLGEGPPLDLARAVELIGEAMGGGVTWVVIPAARLGDDFFRLRTGLAGEITQKFTNYRRKLAILGDVSRYVSQSDALRDFIAESNRGPDIWFVADLDSLAVRIASINR